MASTPAATTPAAPRSGTSRTGGRGVGRRLATETKHALKTTEFYAYVAVLIGLLIAGAAIKGAGTDEFRADEVWLFATILTVGYMVSRGLAKSGSSEPYWKDSGQNNERDNGH
jgi:uncharacterized membrane protein YoaK (UPF0700 family)